METLRATLRVSALATCILFGSRASAATTLTLIPASGTVMGTAGSTVGWGFSINNNTSFLVVTSADFVPASTLGSFSDFIAQFNVITVGPSPELTTVSQTFDSTLQTGIGSFAISNAAPPGASATGQIVLTYDLYSVSPNDPSFDPDVDTISTDNILTTSATAALPAPIPALAPWGLALMALGLLGAGSLLARRRA
jgi:hypothetical protein